MTEKKLFGFERKMDREEVAEYFEAIAKKLRAGQPLTLSSGEKEVKINPAEVVEMEVEVEQVRDETSLEIEIEWSQNKEESLHIE
jgi:amphi-Trp domain-containing protein